MWSCVNFFIYSAQVNGIDVQQSTHVEVVELIKGNFLSFLKEVILRSAVIFSTIER